MIVKTFSAVPGSPYSDSDAEVIGSFLDATFDGAPCLPAEVVDVARPKASPIHPYFEWNDERAAELYRLTKARSILRSILVEVHGVSTHETTRAYQPVVVNTDDGPRPGYVAASVVWSSADLSEQVVHRAKDELNAWKLKYKQYKDLREAIESVEEVISML